MTDHIYLAVKNLDQAKKVYEETLGLEPAHKYVAGKRKDRGFNRNTGWNICL
ncbi:hypothetical protein DESC_780463 [Desulfosarcina cetonica]|uniref:VOC family protein n=1 Tax=Desulfosarcina cetonica TaxID=90730 RepID=UPI001BC4F66C|nr:hypothetical protein DESC_780463 [Desulfosarcina cetonica]